MPGHDIGSITPGRRADPIAVAGDPLAEITLLHTGVVAVMKNGVVVR